MWRGIQGMAELPEGKLPTQVSPPSDLAHI